MDANKIIDNARRVRADAFHTAVALSLVLPIPGRKWVAMCAYCLAKRDPNEECDAYRLTFDSANRNPGGCMSCPYYGADTLVVSVPVEAE